MNRLLILPALLAPATVLAASAAAGTWEGSLRTPNQNLRILFHIKETGGKLAGTMDSPDQGARGIGIQNVRLNGKTLQLQVPSVRGAYTGTLAGDGKRINGQWTQGAAVPLTLKRTSGKGPSAAGDWTGSITAQGRSMRLVFHVKGTGGKLGGTMDSPDQGPAATGIPLGAVSASGGMVRFEVPKAGGRYTGRLARDGSSMSGEWWQGATLPLSLTRSR
jgi:hypothetical protein